MAARASCNRASAVLDARGARSLFSRILSSAAMTRSRAGCVMCSDHPEFRARLQTISVMHMRACNFWRPGPGLNSKFGGQRPPLRPISATDKILKTRGGFANRPLDPAIPVRRRVPLLMSICAPRIGTCSDRFLRRCWPLREIPRSNFQRRLRVGGCAHFASPARCSARCAVSPNREQTIRVGPERYLACCDAKL